MPYIHSMASSAGFSGCRDDVLSVRVRCKVDTSARHHSMSVAVLLNQNHHSVKAPHGRGRGHSNWTILKTRCWHVEQGAGLRPGMDTESARDVARLAGLEVGLARDGAADVEAAAQQRVRLAVALHRAMLRWEFCRVRILRNGAAGRDRTIDTRLCAMVRVAGSQRESASSRSGTS